MFKGYPHPFLRAVLLPKVYLEHGPGADAVLKVKLSCYQEDSVSSNGAESTLKTR